jgi:hypothetical protein
MSALRILCLFSSADLRDGSFFGKQAGHWETDIEQGRCEFVPLVFDDDAPALATCGLFAAATLLCRQEDLGPTLVVPLRAAAAAFARACLPFELVAADSPVALVGWMARQAPGLVDQCHADGEVKPDSPSWWRDRARRHLGGRPSASPVAIEDLAADLASFRKQRGW